VAEANLRDFGPGIWIADGPVVPFLSFPYPTRMAVIRLTDGGLFVWSPIELKAPLRKEVDVLGPVRFLVSPNAIHHLFLGEWKSAYPDARLYASPNLAKKRKDLTFDAELGDSPESEWAADVDQVVVHGSFAMTEVVFFHRMSGTVIFADLIENFPPGWFKGWRRRPARRHRGAEPRRAARVPLELHEPSRGPRRASAHPRLADRARADGPWRSGNDTQNFRAARLRLAARAGRRVE
jgi:Domain of unknown function (DUF4336)